MLIALTQELLACPPARLPSHIANLSAAAAVPQVWLPGDEMEEGETLQYDPSVYDCMSAMSLDWPCLSFDLVRDHLGGPRSAFPHTLFAVAGTQVGAAQDGHWEAGDMAGTLLWIAAAGCRWLRARDGSQNSSGLTSMAAVGCTQA